MLYVIQVSWQLASCQQTCMAYTIAVYTVKTPDDGQRNCPKHVDLYSKNKFDKLVHLVGFIIRIGWNKWQWGKVFFIPINRQPQYNFTKAPCQLTVDKYIQHLY